jgi:hypothetical protein
MRKLFLGLIAVLAFALVATSCTAHVTGGGFVAGDTEGTANFGFNFQCDGHDTKGHLTYHDGDVKIKGTIDNCSFLHKTVQAYGDWVPQGKSTLVGGSFMITGSDEGEPGIGGDTFKIELQEDGTDWDYTNDGVLLGGNIQEHTE